MDLQYVQWYRNIVINNIERIYEMSTFTVSSIQPTVNKLRESAVANGVFELYGERWKLFSQCICIAVTKCKFNAMHKN